MTRILTRRRTVVILFLLLLASASAAALVPQRTAVSPDVLTAWKQQYTFFLPLVDRLGLDRVFTTPWFLVLLAVVLASLLCSLFSQIQIAWRKSIRPDGRPAGIAWQAWGSVCFHTGLVLVACSSLLLAATRQHGMVQLYEGEEFPAAGTWLTEEHGLLTAPLLLAGSLRLLAVTESFWPDESLKQLSSSLSLSRPGDAPETFSIAINQPHTMGGIRFFQTGEHGRAFFLTITNDNGFQDHLVLQIARPREEKPWAYDAFLPDSLPWELQAKYAVNSQPALLVLRLVKEDTVVGRQSFLPGQTGKLGPYTVTLDAVRPWVTIVAGKTHGMPGVFTGFLLIITGSALLYLFPVSGDSKNIVTTHGARADRDSESLVP